VETNGKSAVKRIVKK